MEYQSIQSSNFNASEFIAQFKGQLTPAREAIARELVQRKWFQKSDPKLQAELVTLPQEGAENHDGFLKDLSSRPDKIGGVEVLSLNSLPRGNFALVPVFNVLNVAKNHGYTYEYVSWRYGRLPGAKGLVFVRPAANEAPTHFILLVGEKFAPAEKLYDTIGGFIDLGIEGVQTLTDRILLEMKQELGVDDLDVDEVIDLGQMCTDAGMTNARPGTFVAFINNVQASRIPSEPVNEDIRELESGPLLVPISQLKEIIENTTDSLFCSALLKAVVSEKTDKAFRDAILKSLA